MNILHVISAPAAGGAEIYVRDMAISMREAGHNVHVLFVQTAKESGRDEQYEAQYLGQLKKNKVRYGFIGAKSRKNILWGAFVLRRTVKEFSPDVIHAHLYYALLFTFFVPGVPVLFTKHSIQLGMPALLVKILTIRVSAFVAICEACFKTFFPIVGKKLVRIDNAVDSRRIKKKEITKRRPVNVVYVGRLSPEKNISMLLHACSKQKDIEFRLTIVGEGPSRLCLENLTRTLGLEHIVLFKGSIHDVNSVLSESDIFVLSSLSEGLPISLIEASLTGLPCLVTDVGGCSEVIKKCQNGYVVPSSDLHLYANKLNIMIADSDLRNNLSKNALEFSSCYEIKYAVQRHLDLYGRCK